MQLDNTLNEIFKKLTQELVKQKIEFSIAGAFAVSLYTQPRATSDIDLVTFLDKKNKEKVIDILERNFKLVQSNQEKIPMRFYEIWRQIIKNENTSSILVPIDFISVPKDYFESVLRKSFNLQLNNLDVRFLSKEDLILMKLDSTRAKDIDDIERIVNGPEKVDFDYIKSWAKKYSLHVEMLEKIKKDLNRDFGPEL
jgi:predicted nucleotidyltransferase